MTIRVELGFRIGRQIMQIMSELYPSHKGSVEEAFGLPPANAQTVMERVVLKIRNTDGGVCYTKLKGQFGQQIKNWLPALARNNYADLDKHRFNFDLIEKMKITFKSYPCYCQKRQCKKYMALDRKPDPQIDAGVEATYIIDQSNWTDQDVFKKDLHLFFADETNLIAKQIDENIKEEALEEENTNVIYDIFERGEE